MIKLLVDKMPQLGECIFCKTEKWGGQHDASGYPPGTNYICKLPSILSKSASPTCLGENCPYLATTK